MSAINKALLNISKQSMVTDGSSSLVQANVPNIESKFKASFFFALGAISSLCLLGWSSFHSKSNLLDEPVALRVSTYQPDALVNSERLLTTSPTTKVVTAEVSRIYIDDKSLLDNQPRADKTVKVETRGRDEKIKPAIEEKKTLPINLDDLANSQQQLKIEEVLVLPSTLAQQNRALAAKALDDSNFDIAIKSYYAVLKYQSTDEDSRKRLAALLYGKKEIQESATVLQQGIRLNKDSVNLRLALVSILQKELQLEAALSVLEYVPIGASTEYLAARGGLAQQLKIIDLAEESYQMLVQKEPDNGRWRLGLAIVYERKNQVQDAYNTYKLALMKPGLSRSSLAFVRERITLLQQWKEMNDAS